jgi:tetratricopeptide (TPR) repeat protein
MTTSTENQRLVRDRARFAPAILAVVLPAVLAASEAFAQDVRLDRPTNSLIEITGGAGDARWTLRYGGVAATNGALLQKVSEGRACFSHGSWLRLIDTDAGMVIGRWRFPGEILEMTPSANGTITIVIRVPPSVGKGRHSVSFDPISGTVPRWESGGLSPLVAPSTEADMLLRATSSGRLWETPAADAATRIPDLVELIRRDPLSPWLQIALGKLLKDVGDERASQAFAAAVAVKSTDFTELFRISAMLERLDQPTEAAEAFERAYADFLSRGRDPRLLQFLITRLQLYSPAPGNADELDDRERDRLITRIYQVAPTGEATDLAWRLYADYLDSQGRAAEARTWRERAQVAANESLNGNPYHVLLAHDRPFLFAMGCLLAIVSLLVGLFLKYRRQVRLRLAADIRPKRPLYFLPYSLAYWNVTERLTLLLLASAGWVAIGLASVYATLILRSWSGPILFGGLGGPVVEHWLTTELPDTPARTLAAAIGHQQIGEGKDAERLYRALPQYAESWNNLGVILSDEGKADEARAAYARAREIDPMLPEAALNLGEQTSNAVVNLHGKYLPGRPMIAPPTREHLLEALMGNVWTHRYLWALAGPLPVVGSIERLAGLTPMWGLAYQFLLWLPAAILILIFIPIRTDLTQSPGSGFRLAEVIAPGLAPLWGVLSGPVLALWSLLVLIIVATAVSGSPYVIASAWSFVGRFLLPPGLPDAGTVFDPNPLLIYTAAAALFGVNVALIWRARQAERARLG